MGDWMVRSGPHRHASALKLTGEESVALGAAFSSGDYTPLQSGGVLCEGVKYNFLREYDGIVLAKKKDNGSITAQKTKTAIVIGHTAEGKQQADTNMGVSTIAEYLESLNM